MTLISFPPSSGLVARVAPGLGYRLGSLKPRQHQPAAIVVHTTGSGPGQRFADVTQRTRHGWKCPGDAAVWVYQTVLEFSGHYVLDGENGQLVQVVPEDHIAEHVGGNAYRAYATEHWTTLDTAWWKQRWHEPELHSPISLAGGKLWAGGSVNANTVGIEVAPRETAPRGPWSDAAWKKLVALVREIAARYAIPLDDRHVIGHSDASPLSRSTTDGHPWDPPPAQFTRELLLAHLAAG